MTNRVRSKKFRQLGIRVLRFWKQILFCVALQSAILFLLLSAPFGLLETSTKNSDFEFASCLTTKGEFKVKLFPDLAPNGTAFFRQSIESGYWNQTIPFFRVNKHITQFGPTKRLPRNEDPFLMLRKGADRDVNPYGGVGNDPVSVDKRKAHPWPRGTIASIGGKHFVVVLKENKQMGTNRHDAALGVINEEDMARVFDKLYRYNDIINHPKGGPGVDQGKLMRDGMDYIRKEFPRTDLILGCSFA